MIGFIHNPRVPEAKELVDAVVDALGLQDGSWVSSAEELQGHAERLGDTSAIVTIGGDGTILRATRIAAPFGIPIVGVNMGRVGFMTELTVDECVDRLPFYLSGELRAEERMMLQATVTHESGEAQPTFHALNDVVMSRGVSSRILDVEVVIDGAELAVYRADGVIAATATGSTGYSLSAGGPIMYPEATDMLIQPLAAHISFQTGVVVPAESVFELRVVGDQEAELNIDGFSYETMGIQDKLVVEKSPHVARFLRADSPSAFYSTLTERLGAKGHTPTPAPPAKRR